MLIQTLCFCRSLVTSAHLKKLSELGKGQCSRNSSNNSWSICMQRMIKSLAQMWLPHLSMHDVAQY